MQRIERLSHLAQVVSAIAVVVSIVYLAQQVRANTEAVQYEAARGLRELQLQVDQWDQDPVHVEIMIRGDSDPASLDALEWAQYARRWSNRYSVWSMAQSGRVQGTLRVFEWEGFDRSYRGAVCLPGVRQFWAQRRHWYGGPFQARVDSLDAAC
jgi:hypothetical protein